MCDITAGFLIGCKNSKGGIKRLLLSTDALIPTFDAGEVTAFGGNTPTVIEFLFDAGEAGGNSAATNDRAGSPFYTQTITATSHNRANLKRTQVQNLVAGRPRVIAEAFDGSYSYYGHESGLVATVTENQGQAAGDAVGYTLTFTGEESELPFNCTEAAIDTLAITAASL